MLGQFQILTDCMMSPGYYAVERLARMVVADFDRQLRMGKALGPVLACGPQIASVGVLVIHFKLGPFLGAGHFGCGPGCTDHEPGEKADRKQHFAVHHWLSILLYGPLSSSVLDACDALNIVTLSGLPSKLRTFL